MPSSLAAALAQAPPSATAKPKPKPKKAPPPWAKKTPAPPRQSSLPLAVLPSSSLSSAATGPYTPPASTPPRPKRAPSPRGSSLAAAAPADPQVAPTDSASSPFLSVSATNFNPSAPVASTTSSLSSAATKASSLSSAATKASSLSAAATATADAFVAPPTIARDRWGDDSSDSENGSGDDPFVTPGSPIENSGDGLEAAAVVSAPAPAQEASLLVAATAAPGTVHHDEEPIGRPGSEELGGGRVADAVSSPSDGAATVDVDDAAASISSAPHGHDTAPAPALSPLPSFPAATVPDVAVVAPSPAAAPSNVAAEVGRIPASDELDGSYSVLSSPSPSLPAATVPTVAVVAPSPAAALSNIAAEVGRSPASDELDGSYSVLGAAKLVRGTCRILEEAANGGNKQGTVAVLADRVCVDLVRSLRSHEGCWVGSHAECAALVLSGPPGRPFRINAGPVHSCIITGDGRSKYLSELRPGDEVLVYNLKTGAERSVAVGRVRVEVRPCVIVELRPLTDDEETDDSDGDDVDGQVFLEQTNTVRLGQRLGESTSVRATDLLNGDGGVRTADILLRVA